MSKLKRLKAPKFWKLPKKSRKWAVSPRPGPHRKFESIPLAIALRDIVKIAETGSEAKKIIKMGEILVDGKIRRDHKYPAGLMDAISIPKMEKYFRVVSGSKGLELVEIDKKESKEKICRINDKTIVKKGKVQLNLHDGRSILVDKDAYKTGDSILIEVPSQKIKNHVKLEEGSLGLIIRGKNKGSLVNIKEIIITKGKEPNKIICEMEKKPMEVREDYVLVVGKDSPLIKISG
jgi:small subunit ribosomal protein S4e